MNTLKLTAFCAALLFTAPAHAQASMLLIIGEFPSPRVARVRPADSIAVQIEAAAQRACSRPFIRDLKAQELYQNCLTEARAQAEAQVAERAQASQFAGR